MKRIYLFVFTFFKSTNVVKGMQGFRFLPLYL